MHLTINRYHAIPLDVVAALRVSADTGPTVAPLADTTLLSFAASEIAAYEIAAKNRPPCNGPPI